MASCFPLQDIPLFDKSSNIICFRKNIIGAKGVNIPDSVANILNQQASIEYGITVAISLCCERHSSQLSQYGDNKDDNSSLEPTLGSA
jgi:hypothetical protein